MSEAPEYPDLLSLPLHVNGPRSTPYWGMVWLVVIEATVIGWLVLSYFYLRIEAMALWPPPGIALPEVILPGVAAGVLLLSAVPMMLAVRGVRRGKQGPLRFGLPLGLLLVGAYMVLSVVDANDREYTWATNAYGSIVWAITGYQLLHAAALGAFGSAIFYWGLRGHYTVRRHRGLEVAALYWYFVALAGLPAYATIYLAPYLL